MSTLAKKYCNEILSELDKIPVYLPGTPVNVGDIISFDNGIFRKRPVGSFDHVSKLQKLNVPFEVEEDNEPDPYIFGSKSGVSIGFEAGATAGSVGQGKLTINFSEEGAIYFAALGCTVRKMSDTTHLKAAIEPHKDRLNWKDAFIVTSVTTARKALIMQSKSNNAKLEIEGDVKNLQPGAGVNLDANAGVKIGRYSDASLIKDWSDNVTVFFSLVRFRKGIWGHWDVEAKKNMALTTGNENFELAAVYPEDILVYDTVA